MNQTVTDIIKNAMNSGDSTKFAPVLVTPDVANAILECNYYDNRRLSKANVEAFADILKAGAWTEGSQIRFADDGGEYVLIDGQHRLRAIIDTNISARCMAIVDKNIPSQAYTIADAAGRVRTTADAVHANGIGREWSKYLLNSYSYAVKIIDAEFKIATSNKHNVRSKIVISNSVARDWEATMSSVIAALNPLPKTITSTRAWQKAPILAVLLATWKHQEERARQFWIAAIMDDGLAATRPEKFMHVSMAASLPGGSSAAQSSVNRTARIWNSFYRNRAIERMPTGDNWFPGILGTPYVISK